MAKLTREDLAFLGYQLAREREMVRTMRSMGPLCIDRSLGHLLLGCADRHQQHYNCLLTCLPDRCCPPDDETLLTAAGLSQRRLCSSLRGWAGKCGDPRTAAAAEAILREQQQLLLDLNAKQTGLSEPSEALCAGLLRQLYCTIP